MRIHAATCLAVAAIAVAIPTAAASAPRVVAGCAITQGARCSGARLDGANLRGAAMRNADLRGAHLGRADLRHADLRGARLDRADLRGANLAGARLQGATLVRVNAGPPPRRSGTGMASMSLDKNYCGTTTPTGANLAGANLNGAHMKSGDYTLANMTNASMMGANAHYANFHCAEMAGVNASSSQVPLVKPSAWDDCYSVSGSGAPIKTFVSETQFDGADLTGASFQGFPEVTYNDCSKPSGFGGYDTSTLSGYEPALDDATFYKTNFTQTNLRTTDAPSSSPNKAIWSNTICPDGTVKNSSCF